MPLLLNACPSFSEKWRRRLASCGDEQIFYVDLGVFADHMIDLYEQNKTQEFPAVFDSIERLHLEGDDYVGEAATIGLAEGVLFRDALVRAAKACGLKPVEIPEKMLTPHAERALGIPESSLAMELARLGKAAGPPWGKDQKEAALAAMVALRGRLK